VTSKANNQVLTEELTLKEQRLRDIICQAAAREKPGQILVGFSGGVDSSLLLWESVQSVGSDRVIAVTATSPTSVPEEEEHARRFAACLKVEHLIVPTEECSDSAFLGNPPDRCYLCKRTRYAHLKSLAERLGPAVVVDGTQADDDPSDRPGMRALQELAVLSPLALAGIDKQGVRTLLRAAGFTALAARKAEPCLATRIPTGDTITMKALDQIRRGESFLKALGLETVRLRHHGSWARIVTDRVGMDLMLQGQGLRQQAVAELKSLGYRYVTLDMEEYGANRKLP
jgi:pyridinium-3,5-biscarboxylic acid mononucleotide sulfurtransferase